jgi:hypothetical protein
MITLIGSSIFEQWKPTPKLELKFINLAVGGSTTSFWLKNLNMILPSSSSHIAFYCGSNDINENINKDKIISQTIQCFRLIKEININSEIALFSIMKAPQKKNSFKLIDHINQTIHKELKTNLYIDLNSIINSEHHWYQEDLLHLKEKTYQEIEKNVYPILQNWQQKT